MPSNKTPLVWIAAVVLLIAGFALRMVDLTDQPLDFHPTRQLRSAIIARGIYYRLLPDADLEMKSGGQEHRLAELLWQSTGQYEPSILEFLTALAYRLAGEEILWIARIFTSLFWVLGGLALFDLARRAASGPAGLISLAFYLFLPFAVQASRSFQPDPAMVMWIILAAYFLYRWSENQGRSRTPLWKWSILAGIAGGLAVLTKFPAIYLVGGAAVAMVLSALGARRFWRSPQVWGMAALMLAPALIFYLGRQGRASEYFQDWTLSLSHLLLQPGFYGRWFNLAQELIGLATLLASLAGVIIARPRFRSLLIGLWLGYFLYGLFYPYQLYTHSYYHLQLVPIVALSLAPLAQAFLDILAEKATAWKIILVGITLIGILFASWLYVLDQTQQDYRNEPGHWQGIAAYLPADGKIIALTQDYGYRLNYYGWRKVSLWPNRGEIKLSELRGDSKEFQSFFEKNTKDKGYFLITAFKQFQDQPDLQQYLAENYPVLAEGDGYLIYNLHPTR